ncbi:tryptophan-rich sensory protein [Herbiconiux daphne]|uniref:Tryptophan-rich sensory protein n=1 Tax=Herbiconiux daphne TaxID=2970914 RepID=A0ABT2GZX0_9MICO|nr:tryptophan-rich sensory protein [Herbiconiux daphne]MCS5732284.1 tryptophan-rich sensory protein [Herbiconiux daphne]
MPQPADVSTRPDEGPHSAANGPVRPGDRVRQVVVAASAVIAVVGAFVGSGAAGGTPIQDAAGGALGADSTLIAPAGPAFSIWSVIYAGLLAYAVWQFLPKQTARARQRALGYPVAVTLLLNAAWILSVQSIVLDGTVGLYLGWVCVATAANLTAGLMVAGFDGFSWPPDGWGIAVVVVAGLAGIGLAAYGRGRLAPALSLAWGLAWLAVSRTTGELVSAPVASTAVATAAAVLVATVVIRIAAVAAARKARA